MSDTKNARITWTGQDLNFRALLGSGYEMDLGSPADTTRTSPMEVLLAAVAGCTALDVVSTLRKMRQEISGVEVEISGTRADEAPRVYTRIELNYRVRGRSVREKDVARAIQLSQDTYCSASIMLKRAGAQISTRYEIEEEDHQRKS